MNDSELREFFYLACGGDITAFEKLYRELSASVYTFVLRITGDRFISEDILQDVFLKLYMMPQGAAVRNPKAYIFKIAHNLAVDRMKKQPKQDENRVPDSIPYSRAEFDPDSRVDLERALGTLGDGERKIVVSHINGGLKFREIAEVLDIPLGTVLWKYRRAVSRLRQILNGGM